ncbi:MAG: Crp/Fnr family transcriptional regulator [Gammaproteobacteria bacterium]|nr:Crp/Fnr family transcriptional regulator [Gammaproteobacteria bacterium]
MSIEFRQAYLFARLDEDQMCRVESMSQSIALEDGEALFEVGDKAKRFFLVTGGKIKLSRLSLHGNEKVIEVVRPGHTFAEALMFLERPNYPVRASAIGNTQLTAFDGLLFKQLLRESVDTCFRVMGDMSQRLRHLIKEIDDLTLQSASGRVAGYLCGQYVFQGQDHVEFDLDTPKGILASRLSVKPETFSRILHNFAEKGVVKVTGGHIEILDPARLRDYAQSAGICGQSVSPPKVPRS